VFIIILILVCFFGAAKIKIIVNGDHASKHKRYKDIRYASDTEEALETWQEKYDKNTFHLIVKLSDGLYGDRVIIKTKKGIYEKTAMLAKEGDLDHIHEWLERKANKYEGEI
jgi:hypothetical protein